MKNREAFMSDVCQPMMDLNVESILVSGGTGFFDLAFVRTVLKRFQPKKLIVLSAQC